jgi:predicted permease
MGLFKGLAARARAMLRPRALREELDEEIRLHLDLETEKHVRAGMPRDEARRRARADFGYVERVREEHRAARSGHWLDEPAADVRFALRTLRRSPGLALAAVLTLALGIGANAAIFSAVNAVILRPLPFAAPERLVMLWEENPEKGWHEQVAAPANVLDWRESVPAFADVAAYVAGSDATTLTGDGPPAVLRGAAVTGNFFAVLGVRPLLGRTLTDAETWATGGSDGPLVVVLSERVWRDRFGADPAIVGRSIVLDGRARQVVGVVPASVALPEENTDVWGPVGWDPADRGQTWFRRAHFVRPIARLRPGVTHAQAGAQLQAVVERLKRQYPETNRLMGAGMTPLHEFLVGDTRAPLLVLLGAVALLLLIACANVGNLLLVRAAGYEREVTVRLALGATRMRVVRQAVTDSLVLSAIGGAAGLLVGWAGTRALAALQPEGMLRVSDVGVDWRVLFYVVAITGASGVLFGAAPAVWSGRRSAAATLREGGRGASAGPRVTRWGHALVVAEVAMSLLLAVSAGLLVRSFRELQRVRPGFDADGVLALSLSLPSARYDSAAKVRGFYDELLARARAVPGVERAALVSAPPLTGTGWTSDYVVAGRPPGEYGTEVAHRVVSPDYFRAMRVPVLRGRALADADRQGAAPVVVVNEALARAAFRDGDPVGQRIAFDKVPDSTTTWYTVVGVVGSERQRSLSAEPQIEAYAPFAQDPSPSMTLVARVACAPADPAACDPVRLAAPLRRVVAELDPSLPIHPLRTMAEVRSASLARQRFLMTLLVAFAAVGLVLAVVGEYGVLAQLARRRVREMGIRAALGARPAQVQWLIVRGGLRLTVAGLLVGGGAALLLGGALRGLLYGVPPRDPVTLAGVLVLLTATGAAASWVPARMASRADPARTLRAE